MSRLLVALTFVGLLTVSTSARAERVLSRKTQIVPSSGARVDIFTPHLTNGRSTLGVWNGVAPIIVQHPGLGTENDAQLRPVYNLFYYGAAKAPNSSFMGCIPRPANQLRPNK